MEFDRSGTDGQQDGMVWHGMAWYGIADPLMEDEKYYLLKAYSILPMSL